MRLKFIALAGLLASGLATANPTFVNGLALSGAMLDLSGGTTANTGRVGFFSDIYYDPNRNEWWGLSDRGPGGGTLPYETRVQRFSLDVNPNTGAISNFQIQQTIKFNAYGSPLNGIAPAPSNVLWNAFDPEGIVVIGRTGNLLVSDEYGPSLYEVNRSGQVVKVFNNPANVIPRDSVTGVPNYATDPAANGAGKRTNRGYEGLAISPDGNFAYAMLQSPMLNEGGAAQTGSFARIVKFDIASGMSVAQYAYKMERAGQGQGISSLVALNDQEFLVLERNNRGVGVGATLASADKSVFKINIAGASDVSGIVLPATGTTMPSGFNAVTKGAQFIDLDAVTNAQFGALNGKSPEKWEGLAIGPRLADGSFLILAGTDNDYSVTQDLTTSTQFDVYYRFTDADPFATSIQCPLGATTGCTGPLTSVPTDGSYALLPGVLHAYKSSAIDLNYTVPVPEPGSYAMFLAGLALLGSVAKRRSRA